MKAPDGMGIVVETADIQNCEMNNNVFIWTYDIKWCHYNAVYYRQTKQMQKYAWNSRWWEIIGELSASFTRATLDKSDMITKATNEGETSEM